MFVKKVHRGFEIFNGKHQRYGGHWQRLSKLTGLDYLTFHFGFFKFNYDHEWYDGQHHWLSLWVIRVLWGGPPFKDLD